MTIRFGAPRENDSGGSTEQRQFSHPGWSKEDQATFLKLRQGQSGSGDSLIKLAGGFGASYCTVPGQDPRLDPHNPDSPRYGAETDHQKTGKETENPFDEWLRKQLGPYQKLEPKGYAGRCDDPKNQPKEQPKEEPKPETDPTKIPSV